MISQILEEVLGANAAYAQNFGVRLFYRCLQMDARLDPAKFAGLREGELINWLTIDNPIKSLCVDVKRLQTHPLVPLGLEHLFHQSL